MELIANGNQEGQKVFTLEQDGKRVNVLCNGKVILFFRKSEDNEELIQIYSLGTSNKTFEVDANGYPTVIEY